MVSPLNSLIAGGRAPNMAGGLGDLIRQQSLTDSSLKTQGLQQERMQQQIDQANQPQGISKEQSLGAAKYLNSLGKQLLSTDESQWGQILGPNVPQLQQLGYTPEMLQGMTREQVEGVVGQTEPLIGGQPDQPTAIQTRNQLLQDLKSTDAEVRRSAAIGLGLEGRESGAAPQIVDIGGVPHMFDKQDKTLKPVEIDGQQVTSSTISKSQAEIKAAVTEASANAKRLASDTGEARSNEKALNVYDTAMSGLNKALGGTSTGLTGWLPALTDESRTAEGAVSVMAPILKEIFRSAGEGSFTDSDQKLLMDMVPTRKDGATARKAKMEMIDAVVRAKLGSSAEVTPPQNEAAPTSDAGFDPSLLEFMTPEERELFNGA